MAVLRAVERREQRRVTVPVDALDEFEAASRRGAEHERAGGVEALDARHVAERGELRRAQVLESGARGRRGTVGFRSSPYALQAGDAEVLLQRARGGRRSRRSRGARR